MDRRPLRVLTDTHTLVWALLKSEELGPRARAALEESLFSASVVNLWELILKRGKSHALIGDPMRWWDNYVVRPRIPTLAVRTAHLRALSGLPLIHKDPFDRMLAAQSLADGLTLVTKDGIFEQYGVPVVW